MLVAACWAPWAVAWGQHTRACWVWEVYWACPGIWATCCHQQMCAEFRLDLRAPLKVGGFPCLGCIAPGVLMIVPVPASQGLLVRSLGRQDLSLCRAASACRLFVLVSSHHFAGAIRCKDGALKRAWTVASFKLLPNCLLVLHPQTLALTLHQAHPALTHPSPACQLASMPSTTAFLERMRPWAMPALLVGA